MGCFGSKDKLSKEDMDFLKSHTRYDEATIKEWYKGFKVIMPLISFAVVLGLTFAPPPPPQSLPSAICLPLPSDYRLSKHRRKENRSKFIRKAIIKIVREN